MIVDENAVLTTGFTVDPASLLTELPPPWRTKALRMVDDLGPYTTALRDYLDGDLGALDAVPIVQTGNGFRRRAWQALRQVKAGSVISYRELATRAGNPRAARAAGSACAANLVPLLVPCHRVVGSDGALNHYYYGLGHKRWLLEHEAALPQPRLF